MPDRTGACRKARPFSFWEMSSHDRIADLLPASYVVRMSFYDLTGSASKLTPLIVVSATAWLAFGSSSAAMRLPFSVAAVAVLLVAVTLFAKGGFRNWLRGMTTPMEQLGFKRNRDQFIYALNAEGMPPGFRIVVFVSWLGLVFSGLRFPYLALGIASTFLTLAWGYSSRRFPVDVVAGS